VSGGGARPVGVFFGRPIPSPTDIALNRPMAYAGMVLGVFQFDVF
jgi:hypothetical protein